jgi:hypothetical protein
VLGKALNITLTASDRDLMEAHGQTLPNRELTEM